jgi:hypothetical protein
MTIPNYLFVVHQLRSGISYSAELPSDASLSRDEAITKATALRPSEWKEGADDWVTGDEKEGDYFVECCVTQKHWISVDF